jgi:thymidylate synthase (FAD)
MNSDELRDVENARALSRQTRRPTVDSIETLLHRPQKVLDHGFVRVVDYMGDDDAVVQAARVSYGRGTRQASEDRALIHYLMRHRHTTPFEMCELKLHVKLPIFVARQWIRHRTANVNEYSARYSILDKEFYLPAPDKVAAQAGTNRQGRDVVLEPDHAAQVIELLREDADRAYRNYSWMLNDDGSGAPVDDGRLGVSRELARIGLGVNTYTQWYWKVDLHNLFHFLSLRADPHAQYEIRAYADVILDIVRQWVPVSHAAFVEYRLGALCLSATALALVKRVMAGEHLSFEESGLSRREWNEVDAALGIGGASRAL